MKYLKTYNESLNKSIFKEIKDEISDILLELEDDGFKIEIDFLFGKKILDDIDDLFNKFVPVVTASSEFLKQIGYKVQINRKKLFSLDDVYEYVLTCKSYLKEKGFSIEDIEVETPDSYLNTQTETYNLDYFMRLHKTYLDFNKLDKLVQLRFKIKADE